MKLLYLFIINGEPQSGKDTFINFCNVYSKALYKDIKIYNFSTVDSVKQASEILGWSNKKTEKYRKFLSDLKTLWINSCDGPFKEIQNKIKNIHKQENLESNSFKKIVIFVHCREPEEIKKFDKDIINGVLSNLIYKYSTLLIKRRNLQKFNNKADKEIYKYDYDKVIINDTLPQLTYEALNFLDNL